jgi:hypothetical protein
LGIKESPQLAEKPPNLLEASTAQTYIQDLTNHDNSS